MVDGSSTPRPIGPSPLVPAWLIDLAALGWRLLVVAAMVLVGWYVISTFWVVSASIAVAVVVAAVFAAPVLGLRERGRSRTAAAAIVWVISLLAVTAVLALLAFAFLPYAVELATRIDAGVAEIRDRLAELQAPAAVGAAISDAVATLRSTGGGAVSAVVASAAGVVTVLILATFLIFFLLRDGDRAWMWFFQAIGEGKRQRITTAGDVALKRVGGYLRGTTILSALIALTDLVFMVLLGVPLALPLAVLVFLSGYIPYFGGIVTTAIILVVAYAALGLEPVIVLIVLIGVRNAFLGYLVRPAVYGRTVRIHPALVLLVLPAGFELAGAIGLFAAVPVTAILLAVRSAVVAIIEPVPRPDLPALVPAWLDRVAQWGWRILVSLALIALVVFVATAIPLVVIPLVIAVILAATLEPLIDAQVRRGRSRTRAAGIAVAGGFALVVAVLVATVWVLVDQAGELGRAVTSGARSVDAASGGQLALGVGAVDDGVSEGVATVSAAAAGVATAAVITILSVLLTFYLLRDGPRLWKDLLGRVRPSLAPEVDAAGARAIGVLGGYMIGTGAISFVGAASQLVIMLVLGIPLAVPVFVLSFILCFIPYIGGFISTGIAFLLTVAAGSTADVVIMLIWTVVFNIVQGNVVSPLVYGRTVHLHPAVVLIAIPAGAAAAGMLGMFLVVPAAGVVAATWRSVLAIVARSESNVSQERTDPPVETHASP
jgi:predicted PurR-regulated permease PerM